MDEKVAQRSRELFDSGFYCAESVLLAMAESREIESEFIPGIATGFCSGISGTCGICGAVSGAILGLNLFTGRNSPEEKVDKNYKAVRRLIGMFKEKFGSTNCEELTGYNLGTEEGLRAFRKSGQNEKCREYTGEAARMAMLLLED